MIASMNPVRPPFTKVPDCQTWQNGSASKIAIINWLVVEPPPLKHMTSSVGMMTFPIYVKIKNVPNHQPVNLTQRLDGLVPTCTNDALFVHSFCIRSMAIPLRTATLTETSVSTSREFWRNWQNVLN